MRKELTVLSLFDGISCGQLALKKAKIPVKTYYASEIDKNAIRVTQNNFPQTIQLGDITQIDPTKLKNIDLLIGGSPCQSFSRNGDGTGFDGKSKLFWEYIRILRSLKEVNPDLLFLLENVIMKKEWEEVITEAIGVEPIMIDSATVSAQKRQRLYWTNITNITQPSNREVYLHDILQDKVDEKYFELKEDERDTILILNDRILVKQGTKIGFAEAYEGDSINLEIPKSETRRGRVGKAKTNTLSTSHNYKVVIRKNNKLTLRGLTPVECERLQTVPDNYTEILSERQRIHALGNGWTVDVIAHIFKNIP